MIKILPFLILFAALLGVACGGKNTAENGANVKRYPLKGTVVSVDVSAKRAKVEHERIDGFMEPMTMDFPIHADWVWNELKPGSEIRAELVVDSSAKDPYWLENIGIIATPDASSPVAVNPNFAQVGQPAPDFTLTDQDGKRLTLSGLRGKAVAITFIYARCPLPEYCIRMSTAFSDLAKQLKNDADLKDKIRLVTISFDPENDTPDKLRSYGIGYVGNDPKESFDVWKLAVGKDAEVRKIADFYGLRYEVDEADKTQINHSLRTAVISPDGTVTRIFPGSDWTVEDLKTELTKTLK